MMLPQGKNAEAFHGVRYNLPGLFLFSELIYKYLEIVKSKFDLNINIKYLYGSPICKWNGGRIVFKHNLEFNKIENAEREIFEDASHNITPVITFSNYKIQDFSDNFCNEILNIINKVQGGVIISSPELGDYIRSKFKDVKIHASVIMTAFEAEDKRTSEYYKELSKRYEQYVIHPDDLFNYGLISSIPADNAEILINERCYRNCKLRAEHYKAIEAEQATQQADGKFFDLKFLDKCAAMPEYKQISSKLRTCSLTNSESEGLAELGFKIIKLQGRADSPCVFFFDLMRYSLENNIAFPSMFPVFMPEVLRFNAEY